jgi:outer membrane usher protein
MSHRSCLIMGLTVPLALVMSPDAVRAASDAADPSSQPSPYLSDSAAALNGAYDLSSPSSTVSAGAAVRLTPFLVDVLLNGQEVGVVELARDQRGVTYVPLDLLSTWRIVPPAGDLVASNDSLYVSVATLRGARIEEDPLLQRVAITLPATNFQSTAVSALAERKSPPGTPGTGAYVSYDLLAEVSKGDLGLGGIAEGVVFTRLGVGSTLVAARPFDNGRLVRLASNWTVDDPRRMVSLRLGDSVSRGAVGVAPAHFAGIQVARNFATRPGFLTSPLLVMDGSAASPSIVDVYINNSLSSTVNVESGPFQIRDIPVVSGGGDVQLIVRDPLGRESVLSQSYYSSSRLLRRGLHDFSYEVGFLRRNILSDSADYGPMFASATHRYGVSNRVTAEGHVTLSQEGAAVAAGTDVVIGRIGVISTSVAASQRGENMGVLVAAGVEHQADLFSLGIRAEVASDGFTDPSAIGDDRPLGATIQTFLGVPTPLGNLAAHYLRRTREGDDDVEIFGGSASFQLGAFANLQLSVQHISGPRDGTRAGLAFTLPLGGRRSMVALADGGSGQHRMSASVHQGMGRSGGIAYHASLAHGSTVSGHASLAYQYSWGQLDTALSHSGGQTGLRFGTAGTIGMMGGHVFSARRLDQSFAQVQVDGVEGVRVYADNQLVGKTNRDGILFVPRLLPYEPNKLSIEATDVPMDVTVETFEQVVSPFYRSGALVRFSATQVHGGLLKVVTAEGRDLPSGSQLKNLRTGETFIVAPGGEAYLTGVQPGDQVQASFGQGSCGFMLTNALGEGGGETKVVQCL